MRKAKYFFYVIALVILLIVTTGCIAGSSDDVQSDLIDPPQVNLDETDASDIVFQLDEADDDRDSSDANVTDTERQVSHVERTLYLFDHNGYVVPITLSLPYTQSVATQALQYLVEGGPIDPLLPSGIRAVLPEGTELTVDIDEDGTATVDFSPEFLNYQAEDERGILEAITFTLTQFDTVDQVRITINGYPYDEMPVNGTPIDQPLSRKDGINLEIASGAHVGQSTAVSLYFLGQNSTASHKYYVPVTRLIPRTDDIYTATVKEYISGPRHGSGLVSALPSSTKLLSMEQNGKTLTLDFDEQFLEYTLDAPKASDEAMTSLVLSLTEYQGIEHIQFKVEGSDQLASDRGVDLSQPVSRPITINSTGF